MRSTRSYYIQEYDKLLYNIDVNRKNIIPSVWKDYVRINVDKTAKEKAVKYCIDTWVTWEQESKKFYENCYCNLNELFEISACHRVMKIINEVDTELFIAKNLQLKLETNNYELQYIYNSGDLRGVI